MNHQPSSQILDAVARDQVPGDLDLAPAILARIQKRKGFRMNPKMKLVSAILLVAIVLTVLFYTVPGVMAAVGRWFGFIPGVGLVREGQIRALEAPVSLTRDGVTVTVEQVILNQERTALVYSVDGIPNDALVLQPKEPVCDYKVSLRLPDGQSLLASPNGIDSWASGYLHRFYYAPLPGSVDEATLVIPCFFQTRPGAAPENWEIPLHFVAAPPDMTAFPVIEISTPTPPAVEATATTGAAEVTPQEPTPTSAALSLTLDRAVQMDDGYLLYATLHWEDTPFIHVDVTDPQATLHLLDSAGQEMLYEFIYDENTGPFVDQRQTVIAIKTAPVQSPGPLTLALDSVSVDHTVDARFVFDPGVDAAPGQEFKPNIEVAVGEHRLVVRTVWVNANSYEFEITSNTGVQSASCIDRENPVVGGGGGGGGQIDENTYSFSCGFNYQNARPAGPVTVTLGSITVRHEQPLQVQWTPPAVSTTRLPTQPAACLTAEAWQAALAQPFALPEGLSGQVLTYGPADPATPDGSWEVAITPLDGSQAQPLPGVRDGAFSPDGSKLAYSLIDGGILIKDLVTGEDLPLPGTANGDFNPIWSPDGAQIVFNRGMGIFDLFIVNLDGSNLRQITHGGVQEWPVGWLPDGGFLYTVPGREYEYIVYRLDLASGESQVFSNENIQSLSPDGQYVAIANLTFGERWAVDISRLDGADRWALANDGLWVLSPLWSPDGEWLLATVSATDSGSTTGALINLRTCQIIALPHIQGNLLDWKP